MNLPILPIVEDLDILIDRGIRADFLWGCFRNEEGTYTIVQLVADDSDDEGYVDGEVVSCVDDGKQAQRIVDMHNATVVAASRIESEEE